MLPFRLSSLLAAASYALQARAASTQDTVQLFIDNLDPNAGWGASVQNACNGSTTYVLSCTSAPNNNACSPQTATVTAGSDFYMVTTPAIYSETSATKTESCHLNTAESSASCLATIVAGNYGNDISTTVSYNLTGTQYYQYDVQITAGASHTADGGACLKKSDAAEPRSREGGMLTILSLCAILGAGLSGVFAL